MNRRRYSLVIEDEESGSTWHGLKPEARLKRVLKGLLRVWGFRCVGITPDASQDASEGADPSEGADAGKGAAEGECE